MRCLRVFIYIWINSKTFQNIKIFTSNKQFLHIKPYHSRLILRLSLFCCRGPAADSFSEFNLAEQLTLASENKIRSQFSSSKPSISLGELLLLISVWKSFLESVVKTTEVLNNENDAPNLFWTPKMFTSRSTLLHNSSYDVIPARGNGDKFLGDHAKLYIQRSFSIKKNISQIRFLML